MTKFRLVLPRVTFFVSKGNNFVTCNFAHCYANSSKDDMLPFKKEPVAFDSNTIKLNLVTKLPSPLTQQINIL